MNKDIRCPKPVVLDESAPIVRVLSVGGSNVVIAAYMYMKDRKSYSVFPIKDPNDEDVVYSYVTFESYSDACGFYQKYRESLAFEFQKQYLAHQDTKRRKAIDSIKPLLELAYGPDEVSDMVERISRGMEEADKQEVVARFGEPDDEGADALVEDHFPSNTPAARELKDKILSDIRNPTPSQSEYRVAFHEAWEEFLAMDEGEAVALPARSQVAPGCEANSSERQEAAPRETTCTYADAVTERTFPSAPSVRHTLERIAGVPSQREMQIFHEYGIPPRLSFMRNVLDYYDHFVMGRLPVWLGRPSDKGDDCSKTGQDKDPE